MTIPKCNEAGNVANKLSVWLQMNGKSRLLHVIVRLTDKRTPDTWADTRRPASRAIKKKLIIFFFALLRFMKWHLSQYSWEMSRPVSCTSNLWKQLWWHLKDSGILHVSCHIDFPKHSQSAILNFIINKTILETIFREQNVTDQLCSCFVACSDPYCDDSAQSIYDLKN